MTTSRVRNAGHVPGARPAGRARLPGLSLALAMVSLAVTAGAKADPYRQSAPNLGGGFIEFIMTGQAPGPRHGGAIYNVPPQPHYARPVQRQALASPYLEDEPLQQPGLVPRGPRRDRAAAPIEPGFDSRFEKQEVTYGGNHAPGTIIIDTPNKYLYLVQGQGRALRYGIGVGRPGFEWAGVKTVSMKREWPDWRPPEQMLRRRPDLPRHMAGGPDNPLGARALYLGSSLYRIHGTNEPETIGRAVSSGCIRMRNEDVIDLYGRVRVGTKVVVI